MIIWNIFSTISDNNRIFFLRPNSYDKSDMIFRFLFFFFCLFLFFNFTKRKGFDSCRNSSWYRSIQRITRARKIISSVAVVRDSLRCPKAWKKAHFKRTKYAFSFLRISFSAKRSSTERHAETRTISRRSYYVLFSPNAGINYKKNKRTK